MTTMQRVVRGVVLVLAIGAVSAAVYWAQTRGPGERAQVSPSMAATPAALPAVAPTTPAAAAPAPTPEPIVLAPATAAPAAAQAPNVGQKVERSVYFSTSKAAMAPSFDEPQANPAPALDGFGD